MATHDNSLGAIIALKKALPITVVISWDPDRLLGIIGLEHVLTLHLHGDDKVRKRIRIRLSGLSELDMARHDWMSSLAFAWQEKKGLCRKYNYKYDIYL